MKNITKNEYNIGDIIKLRTGFIGEVVSVAGIGRTDIRPPYHRKGVPTIKGLDNYYGYVDIIPHSWDILYRNEVSEYDIVIHVAQPKVKKVKNLA